MMNLPEFKPRPPWLGGDLQTLRNMIVRPVVRLGHWSSSSLTFPQEDGDCLLGTLNQADKTGTHPLGLLLHGLTGSEDSLYMRCTAQTLLKEGRDVLRLNHRGAGPSGPLCRQSYHAGRTQDLRAVLGQLGQQWPTLKRRGVFLVGYSLGANMLLKFLGEGESPVPIRFAVSVSAPIDLLRTQEAIMRPRNRVYHSYLMNSMRREVMASAQPDEVRDRRWLMKLHSVWDFDEYLTAPRNGFAGARDYYNQNSALNFLDQVAVPCLVLHAQDDPWIPGSIYRGYDWRSNSTLSLVMPHSGGHVGFHGVGSQIPWHDRCTATFARGMSKAG